MTPTTSPTNPTPGTIELLLVGTHPDLTGDERLLAGVPDGDDVLVLVEVERASNHGLLEAGHLHVHVNDQVQRRPVTDRRTLTADERRTFEAMTPAPLGINLEVIRLGPPAVAAAAQTLTSNQAEVPNGTDLKTLSEARCWELLRRSSVGRLAVIFNGAPDIFPVNHAVIDETIVIRTAPGTKLVSAIDHAVAFEVDQLDHTRQKGWSVVVHGTAEEPRKIEDYLTALDEGPNPWAAGNRDRFIVITATRVSGRVLPPATTGVSFCSEGR
jgi:nitroimidazol reductase NimA-like FMN-containing flavoprotein (pyridoxamine 5'-phosphate oxidase superfamily)